MSIQGQGEDSWPDIIVSQRGDPWPDTYIMQMLSILMNSNVNVIKTKGNEPSTLANFLY